MNCRQFRSVLSVAALLACAVGAAPALAAESVDPQIVAEASGAKPTVTDDGVVRIGWSRNDVEVTVDGMPLPPAAGLGSWAAFTATDTGAMVMGDRSEEHTSEFQSLMRHSYSVFLLTKKKYYNNDTIS